MRNSFVALVGLLACTAPAAAQSAAAASDSAAIRLPLWHVGATVDIGQPIGDLQRNVKSAVGAQGHALLRLDRTGRMSLRVQGGWLNYGSEHQRSCLGTAPHCRVKVQLTTANGILSLALGPQLTIPVRRVRAYGFALAGMSRFATVSGLDGGLVPDIVAADENFGDGGLVLTGGVGVQLPVHRRASIDIGVGYEHHGTRRYLLEGGLTDKPDGTLGFDIKRSRADLFVIRLGLTTAIHRKPRKPSPS